MKLMAIVLTGSDSFEVKLVPASASEWINQGPKSQSGWHEEIPEAVLADLEKMGVARSAQHAKQAYITIGTYQNDRALALEGLSMPSLVEMVEYLGKDQSYGKPELVEEFIGFSY